MDTQRETEDTRALHKVIEVEWIVCDGELRHHALEKHMHGPLGESSRISGHQEVQQEGRTDVLRCCSVESTVNVILHSLSG
jgi:hypothetical protein